LQDENNVIIIETEGSYRSNFLLIVIEIFINGFEICISHHMQIFTARLRWEKCFNNAKLMPRTKVTSSSTKTNFFLLFFSKQICKYANRLCSCLTDCISSLRFLLFAVACLYLIFFARECYQIRKLVKNLVLKKKIHVDLRLL
jgi:hypothetical protein